MGSLALAAYGAVGGAGQGLTDIGKEGMKEQLMQKESDMAQAREETIARLRDKFEKENIANQQTFAAGQTETKLTAASAAAGATRRFEHEENISNRASREKVGAGHDTAKVDTAAISAYSKTGGKNTVKPLQSVTQNIMPTGPDGKPIPGALPEQHKLTYDPNTGIHWVQNGDRFYRAGQDGKPVIDPKATARNVTPGETQALLANPYARVPSGYKNGGMTYAEAFEQEHGHLPAAFLGTVNKLSQQSNSSSGIRLPSGRVFSPGAGGGAEGGADDDVSNANEEQASDQPFQSNAMSSYAAHSE